MMKVALYGVWHVHASDYTKAALKHADLIGFYEKDDAIAAAYQQRFNVPRIATEEELLSSDAEGIIVCTATSEHVETMIRIAEAKKHIFTEKVLAFTDEDCRKIEEAVQKNGVRFTISLPQRYSGVHMTILDVAASGELGKINMVRFRNCHAGASNDWLPAHFFNREQCGGGAMIDLGTHGMYLIHAVLGLPQTAKSVFTVASTNASNLSKNTDRVEDNAVTVLGYPDGAIAINETGFVSDNSPASFEVYGEKGYVFKSGNQVFKRTAATNGQTITVPVKEDAPLPIVQFLKNEPLPGCSMEEAKALTHMMVMAYANA